MTVLDRVLYLVAVMLVVLYVTLEVVPNVVLECSDRYQPACVEDGGGLRVDCDAPDVWCDDEGA